MMYKSQFRKIDPYDWFCGPGSHICLVLFWIVFASKLYLICAYFSADWDKMFFHWRKQFKKMEDSSFSL